MEKNLIVYRLFFKNSDKSYIGITNNLTNRLSQHIRNANIYKKNFSISKAIRKYGNPECEILEIVDSLETLLEREIHYIKEYNSFECGYNETLGGQGSFGSPREKSLDWKKEHSSRMSGTGNPRYGIVLEEQWKKNQSERMKEFYKNNPSKKAFGNKSSLNMIWINDGSIERKILKYCDIPENFIRGRLKKNFKNHK
jgi:group I intron endonuclease